MKTMLFGLGLLLAGTIGLAGFVIAVCISRGESPMLIVYGINSIIGLIIAFLGYSEKGQS
jgi:hypothetical protein